LSFLGCCISAGDVVTKLDSANSHLQIVNSDLQILKTKCSNQGKDITIIKGAMFDVNASMFDVGRRVSQLESKFDSHATKIEGFMVTINSNFQKFIDSSTPQKKRYPDNDEDFILEGGAGSQKKNTPISVPIVNNVQLPVSTAEEVELLNKLLAENIDALDEVVKYFLNTHI
jgi:hypothetical protein